MKKGNKLLFAIILILTIMGAIVGWKLGQLILDASTEIRTKDILLARVGLPLWIAILFGVIGFFIFGKGYKP